MSSPPLIGGGGERSEPEGARIMIWLILQSALGLVVLIAACWAMSENRRAFSWRLVAAGLALQFAVAALLLGVGPARDALYSLNGVVDRAGGGDARRHLVRVRHVGGGDAPFDVTKPQNMGSLAFQALPLVLVMSALAALLWYWRVLPHDREGLCLRACSGR